METVHEHPRSKVRVPLAALLVTLILVIGAVIAITALSNSGAGSLLTQDLSEPLGGVTAAKINIDPGDGNLVIDAITGGEPVLASGSLQYLEKNGLPTTSLDTSSGQPIYSLKATGGQQWLRLPWAACNGATEWQIHLNPGVKSDINAHSDGGNISLNLTGMAVTGVQADTGGGNVDVILPDNAANFSVTAKTGAGNVEVRVPEGTAARIHATSGMGEAIIDPRFNQIDETTYQSPDYDSAANKVEITISSGAGNVSVITK